MGVFWFSNRGGGGKPNSKVAENWNLAALQRQGQGPHSAARVPGPPFTSPLTQEAPPNTAWTLDRLNASNAVVFTRTTAKLTQLTCKLRNEHRVRRRKATASESLPALLFLFSPFSFSILPQKQNEKPPLQPLETASQRGIPQLGYRQGSQPPRAAEPPVAPIRHRPKHAGRAVPAPAPRRTRGSGQTRAKRREAFGHGA